MTTLVEARDLVYFHPARGAAGPAAVDGVSLRIGRGESLALIGESGSGKTTTARLLTGLIQPASGRVRIAGDEPGPRRGPPPAGARVAMVAQDPSQSFDPRLTIAAALGEPLTIRGAGSAERRAATARLLERAGLSADIGDRRPSAISGGQLRRAAFARALASEPDLLILDEPVSGLDGPARRGIVELLRDLRRPDGPALLVIGHDLDLAGDLSDRAAVMYAGRIVEEGSTASVLADPAHHFTAALASALPPPRVALARALAAPAAPVPPAVGDGCRYRSRCPLAHPRCATERPRLDEVRGRRVACHRPTGGTA